MSQDQWQCPSKLSLNLTTQTHIHTHIHKLYADMYYVLFNSQYLKCSALIIQYII